MGKLFSYRGLTYGIDRGYYRLYNSRFFDPFYGPYFKSWINLKCYIDVLYSKH